METAVAENYDTNPAFAQGGNLDIPAFGGPMGIRWDEGESYEPLLQHDYVMDIDNTVKCIFGHQEGAEVGYKWNVFCRLAEGGRHMEAITSRPMLMGIVGRIVTSGRKRCMHLTSTHADAPEIRESLERIGAFFGAGAISATAPQLGFDRTWALILRVAFRKWLGGRPLDPLFDGDQTLLRLSG